MILEVVSPILGFETVASFKFEVVDDNFAQIHNANDTSPSFSLINPFALRPYAFDVPDSLQDALQLKQASNYLVYCIMVVNKPLENSLINFLAPIVINVDNKTMAQVVLDDVIYQHFGTTEPLSAYVAAQ